MAISSVKTVGTNNTVASGTTLAVTVPAGGVAQNNHVTVSTTCTPGATVTMTCADSKGNTYQDDVKVQSAATANVYVMSAKIATALVSGDLITVTFSATNTDRGMVVEEWNGMHQTTWLDKVASSTGTSTTPNSTATATTTNANDLCYGACAFSLGGGTYAAGTGGTPTPYAKLNQAGNSRQVASEYVVVSSTGTYSAYGTITSVGWRQVIATYIPAAVAAVSSSSTLMMMGAG